VTVTVVYMMATVVYMTATVVVAAKTSFLLILLIIISVYLRMTKLGIQKLTVISKVRVVLLLTYRRKSQYIMFQMKMLQTQRRRRRRRKHQQNPRGNL
jgi:hypothetical protein